MPPPHPLDGLSFAEVQSTREQVLALHPGAVLIFREMFIYEPKKAELTLFLDLEHDGKVDEKTPRPDREVMCFYDVVGEDKIPVYTETIVNVTLSKIVSSINIDTNQHSSLTVTELQSLVTACWKSQTFLDAIAEFQLPQGFEAIVEPWPYGGRDGAYENKRYFQGLVFAQDKTSQNPDSNFYCYPLPLIPVMDAATQEIVRIDRLATGGEGDGMEGVTHAKEILAHCKKAEYVPELLENGTREDLKALNVVQPDGPSFQVDGNLITWQKWRLRVGFNPREGATIHDVHYDGRSVLYRLALSEMTVPYADARSPFHRKQAFDFGDGGLGNCANNLSLGCDCLGVIKYFDTILTTPTGEPQKSENVICLHEQDAGIGWKHTNWRTGRAVVTRRRELVIQFVITLANYDYVFSYKFNQAGEITVETRATGIVSVVNIDPGKTSAYGNVVSSGVLAQNHQHIFAIRIDPAIDGHKNSIIVEESHPVPTNPDTNPRGNFYEVRQDVVGKSTWLDAAPLNNRVIKMVNPSVKNAVSGKPVGYKFTPSPTQLLLADENSLQSKRAKFARHHVWVSKYKDREFYAAGPYTMLSDEEKDGLADIVARGENVEDEDVVVWNCFGLTHNPRVEDWPVMPVEIHELTIKPVDFFTANPALDVPSSRNLSSRLADVKC